MLYLLILIGCDGGEHGLGEGEGAGALSSGDSPHWGQLLATLLPDDMHPRLVLVHGVQDDLGSVKRSPQRGVNYTTDITHCYKTHLLDNTHTNIHVMTLQRPLTVRVDYEAVLIIT